MHEYPTVTAIWKGVLECLSKMSEKLQTTVLNIFEGYHLTSFNPFFFLRTDREFRLKLVENEAKTIKMNSEISTSYFDTEVNCNKNFRLY